LITVGGYGVTMDFETTLPVKVVESSGGRTGWLGNHLDAHPLQNLLHHAQASLFEDHPLTDPHKDIRASIAALWRKRQ